MSDGSFGERPDQGEPLAPAEPMDSPMEESKDPPVEESKDEPKEESALESL